MNLFVSTPKRKDFHYGYKATFLEHFEVTVARLLSQSSSFRRAPPKLQRIYSVYYKDAKENDQTIFLHMAFFVTYGVN